MSFWCSQDLKKWVVHIEPGSKYFYLLTMIDLGLLLSKLLLLGACMCLVWSCNGLDGEEGSSSISYLHNVVPAFIYGGLRCTTGVWPQLLQTKEASPHSRSVKPQTQIPAMGSFGRVTAFQITRRCWPALVCWEWHQSIWCSLTSLDDGKKIAGRKAGTFWAVAVGKGVEPENIYNEL